MSAGRLRPRPTSTKVPTRERTIWWQKALASISKASRSPQTGVSPPVELARPPTRPPTRTPTRPPTPTQTPTRPWNG